MSVASQLLPLITTPYLPLLGPVHPSVVTAELLETILATEPGLLLDYDKDRRWYTTKPEHIVSDSVLAGAAGVVIPLANELKTRLRLLCYGATPEAEIQQLASHLQERFPAASTLQLAFTDQLGSGADGSTLFLQSFSRHATRAMPEAVERITQANATDLTHLATDSENAGFGFLAEAYAEHDLGPTLAIRAGGRVVAAIGPLDTLPDSAGVRYLLPPYFGVAESARRQGYGALLWQALVAEAVCLDARYLLVQAGSGSAAEAFYRRQGLVALGSVVLTQTLSPA